MSWLTFKSHSSAQQTKQLISQTALIAVVENHKGAVLRYIDAAPDSMLGFRPTKGVRTFAEQIEHAAGSDALIAHLAITGSSKVPPMGDSAVGPPGSSGGALGGMASVYHAMI